MTAISRTGGRLALPRVFYGWRIVFASIPISLITIGTFFYGFTTLFDPIVREFGWSRALTSTAFTLQRGESGIAGPIVGTLTDRLGPRRIMIVGALIAGGGFIFLGNIHNLWQFYLAFLIIAIGVSGTSSIVSVITVTQWFTRKRGRALSIMAVGAGASGLMVYLMVWAIDDFGWRDTVKGIGVAIWLIVIPLALIYRHRPQQYGMRPDGLTDAQLQAEAKAGRAYRSEQSLDFSAAVHSRAFWTMGVSTTLWDFVHTGVISQLISALTITGEMDRTLAGITAAMVPLVSIVSRLGIGILADYLEKRTLMAASLLIQTVGVLLFVMATNPAMAVMAGVLYGIGFGGFIPVRSALQADLFGPRHYGSIEGGTQFLAMAGGITGPVLAGAIADAQGTYDIAYYIFAAALLVAVPLILMTRNPKPQERLE